MHCPHIRPEDDYVESDNDDIVVADIDDDEDCSLRQCNPNFATATYGDCGPEELNCSADRAEIPSTCYDDDLDHGDHDEHGDHDDHGDRDDHDVDDDDND